MRKQVNYLILKFLEQVYPDSLTVKMIEAVPLFIYLQNLLHQIL